MLTYLNKKQPGLILKPQKLWWKVMASHFAIMLIPYEYFVLSKGEIASGESMSFKLMRPIPNGGR